MKKNDYIKTVLDDKLDVMLEDSNINIIFVNGIYGVGKTELVNNVIECRRKKRNILFRRLDIRLYDECYGDDYIRFLFSGLVQLATLLFLCAAEFFILTRDYRTLNVIFFSILIVTFLNSRHIIIWLVKLRLKLYKYIIIDDFDRQSKENDSIFKLIDFILHNKKESTKLILIGDIKKFDYVEYEKYISNALDLDNDIVKKEIIRKLNDGLPIDYNFSFSEGTIDFLMTLTLRNLVSLHHRLIIDNKVKHIDTFDLNDNVFIIGLMIHNREMYYNLIEQVNNLNVSRWERSIRNYHKTNENISWLDDLKELDGINENIIKYLNASYSNERIYKLRGFLDNPLSYSSLSDDNLTLSVTDVRTKINKLLSTKKDYIIKNSGVVKLANEDDTITKCLELFIKNQPAFEIYNFRSMYDLDTIDDTRVKLLYSLYIKRREDYSKDFSIIVENFLRNNLSDNKLSCTDYITFICQLRYSGHDIADIVQSIKNSSVFEEILTYYLFLPSGYVYSFIDLLSTDELIESMQLMLKEYASINIELRIEHLILKQEDYTAPEKTILKKLRKLEDILIINYIGEITI